MIYYWGNDPRFAGLPPHVKAAIIARMEADQGLGPRSSGLLEAASMVNRASKGGYGLDADFHRREGRGYERYQPLNEPGQHERLPGIMADPQTAQLAEWLRLRQAGAVPDPANGATHFGATIPVMERLSAAEPAKYRTWRTWMRDDTRVPLPGDQPVKGHHFYAPEGRHSAPYDQGAAERELTGLDANGQIEARIAPFQLDGVPGAVPQGVGGFTPSPARAPAPLELPVATPSPPTPPQGGFEAIMAAMKSSDPKVNPMLDIGKGMVAQGLGLPTGTGGQQKDQTAKHMADAQRAHQGSIQEWERRRQQARGINPFRRIV